MGDDGKLGLTLTELEKLGMHVNRKSVQLILRKDGLFEVFLFL